MKLDLGLMLWNRHLIRKGVSVSACLLADASQQKGEEFFCQRMDAFLAPPGCSTTQRLELDVNVQFSRSILPLMVLGHGESDLSHKLQKVLHASRLVFGPSEESFRQFRLSIRGMCADQGALVAMGLVGASRLTQSNAPSSRPTTTPTPFGAHSGEKQKRLALDSRYDEHEGYVVHVEVPGTERSGPLLGGPNPKARSEAS